MNKITREEKLKRKQYNEMNKKYKKELKKLIKEYYPYDNSIETFFDIQVRHWIDYYSLGYNVMAMETKDVPEFCKPNAPTRLEIAKKLKELYDNYDNFNPLDAKFRSEDGIHLDMLKIEDAYYKTKKELFDYYFKYGGEMWD